MSDGFDPLAEAEALAREEKRINQILVTGAMMGVLSKYGMQVSEEGTVTPVTDIWEISSLGNVYPVLENGVATNELYVTVPFMGSRYRLTVTLDPLPR